MSVVFAYVSIVDIWCTKANILPRPLKYTMAEIVKSVSMEYGNTQNLIRQKVNPGFNIYNLSSTNILENIQNDASMDV